jgi:integrase
LRWEWIDFDRRVILLPDSKTGAKQIYLNAPAMEILMELRKGDETASPGFVITGRLNGRAMVNLAKPWKKVCEIANLSGVRLHDLRHTAASIGLAAGLSLPMIGRLLGHTQAQTTQRYAHLDLHPALAAADQIGAVVARRSRGERKG